MPPPTDHNRTSPARPGPGIVATWNEPTSPDPGKLAAATRTPPVNVASYAENWAVSVALPTATL